MASTAQIIPKWDFPHQEVFINDYTHRDETPSSMAGDTYMLFVFASPKGPDRVMTTIDRGAAQFVNTFGTGSFKLYGQPLMNAYACVTSGAATLQCLRVTADNATFANTTIFVAYKTVTATGEDGVETSKLSVRFFTKSAENFTDINTIDDIGNELLKTLDAPAEGEIIVPLQTIACKGRGIYGNPLRVRYTTQSTLDKENAYKNYYLEVYENTTTLSQLEMHHVVLQDEVLINELLKSVDDVISDPDSGSNYIRTYTNYDGFNEIYKAYKELNPDTHLTLDTFDVILGIDKTTKEAIANYEIDFTSEDSIQLNTLTGIPLSNGSDGDFGIEVDEETRKAALEAAYLKAYQGVYDPNIKSKNKFPTNIILDANFELETKKAIATLAVQRTDCVAILDCGTGLLTHQAPLDYANAFGDYASDRVHFIDAYAMKVKDPVSKKVCTVTSTYWLASAYPLSFQANNGKHVPLAGSNYGVMSGFIKNSVYPTYDVDIDYELMDKLADAKINFAQVNANNQVMRATQTSRQKTDSDLSEANAVFILLDVKRDCERINDTYSFQFSDPSDLNRFKIIANNTLGGYAGTQLVSLDAVYQQSEWEAERSILHLIVTIKNRNIVKTVITEIDVV